MSNPSKQKGTRAETKVVRYLKEHGVDARRKALSGSKDEGDVELPELCVSLEVKSGKQTDKYNRAQLNEWLRQAREEQENARQRCYLVVARHGRSVKDYEVWWKMHPDSKVMQMQYLDDWTEEKRRILDI